MVALKAGEIESFLRKPDPAVRIFLLYGPDIGLAHERSRKLIAKLIDDPEDAFQLIRIDGESLGSDTSRLHDEANTVGLFGDKRAIWLRSAQRLSAGYWESLFKEKPLCPIIIEAGDLPARHALRSATEACKHAAALPCYADDIRDLPRLIDEVLGSAGLSATDEARMAMTGALGADRLLSRRELEKLALYCHGQKQVTLEDVESVFSNASQISIDVLVDSVFSGDASTADIFLERAVKEGFDPSMIIGALLRQAFLLLNAQKNIEDGRSLPEVEKQARIFFKRAPAFRKQVTLWSTAALQSAIIALGDAQLSARQNAALSLSLVSRLCLSLSLAARRNTSNKRH